MMMNDEHTRLKRSTVWVELNFYQEHDQKDDGWHYLNDKNVIHQLKINICENTIYVSILSKLKYGENVVKM